MRHRAGVAGVEKHFEPRYGEAGDFGAIFADPCCRAAGGHEAELTHTGQAEGFWPHGRDQAALLTGEAGEYAKRAGTRTRGTAWRRASGSFCQPSPVGSQGGRASSAGGPSGGAGLDFRFVRMATNMCSRAGVVQGKNWASNTLARQCSERHAARRKGSLNREIAKLRNRETGRGF